MMLAATGYVLSPFAKRPSQSSVWGMGGDAAARQDSTYPHKQYNEPNPKTTSAPAGTTKPLLTLRVAALMGRVCSGSWSAPFLVGGGGGRFLKMMMMGQKRADEFLGH